MQVTSLDCIWRSGGVWRNFFNGSFALVDDVPLGPDCYKVWVRDVLISNISLPRPSRLHFTVDDAMASTVAWPSKYIDLF
ncbi:hypothetical protein Sjap_012560 [Stephania japonica]|uniref:Uncharacterized protein n=1 Tax=Stephania japonica TaxID=461633 RepID=A0AAP0IY02_9MAGN